MAGIFDECSQQAIPDELEILRSALYNLSEGVVVADTKGRFLICNDIARSVLGIAIGNNAPRDWSEVRGCYKTDGQTPYDTDELPSTRALSGETVRETEIFIRNEQCPSGLWVTVQARPLLKESGEIRGSVVVFRDISMKASGSPATSTALKRCSRAISFSSRAWFGSFHFRPGAANTS